MQAGLQEAIVLPRFLPNVGEYIGQRALPDFI